VLREEAYSAFASSGAAFAAASYSMQAGGGAASFHSSRYGADGSSAAGFTAGLEGRQVAAELLSHLDCEWYKRAWARMQARAGFPV
jgi:hypothetical protein